MLNKRFIYFENLITCKSKNIFIILFKKKCQRKKGKITIKNIIGDNGYDGKREGKRKKKCRNMAN